MLRLKGCPRCNGDIFQSRDHHGWYEHCLQCGYLRDLEWRLGTHQPVVEMEKRKELANAR